MDRRVADKTRELNQRHSAQKPARRLARLAPVCVLIELILAGCRDAPEARLRKLLASQMTGTIRLPAGVVEVSSELQLARGAHDLEIVGAGTVLKASDRFQGRAVLVAEDSRRIRLRNLSIDGNRAVLEKPLDLAGGRTRPFREVYSDNGMWFDRVDGLEISDLHLARIANFAILISRSTGIAIRRVDVRESGSRSPRGRNNATGGILLEEGSLQF